jgi:hypothetical protein
MAAVDFQVKYFEQWQWRIKVEAQVLYVRLAQVEAVVLLKS